MDSFTLKKLFLNPDEEQSEIDDDEHDEHESSAHTRHVGFAEVSKPEDKNKNVSKGSTIKGKIMEGATVVLAALSPFLFKNNPDTQDVSAVVASGHPDASLVASPQGLPSGNFVTNINAVPAVKLPHDPFDASLQIKGGQFHKLANSGSDEKGKDVKNVAGQGTGVTVDKKKQNDTTPTSNNNSSVPTDDQIRETSHELNELKKSVDRIVGKKPSGNNAFSLANSTSNVTILDDYVCSANLLDSYGRSTPEQKLKAWSLTEPVTIQATLDYSYIMKVLLETIQNKTINNMEAPSVKVEEATTMRDSNSHQEVEKASVIGKENVIEKSNINENSNINEKASINEKANVVQNHIDDVFENHKFLNRALAVNEAQVDGFSNTQNHIDAQEPETAQDNENTYETQETVHSTIDRNISIENTKSSSILDSLVAEDSDNVGNSGIIVGSIAAGLGLIGAGSFAYKKQKKVI
ncbi:hypothetical protein ROZALSC1DRAFT_24031 [Rozella allomycis CSF55]|uniref:Uncharacterized protein n=1 Tax=Rozella allomycis (strain CSF55) TaxID=988480 RepID=A0A4P9YG58_ROZAC|nr:hypothetical protein ROZALSC1DRAFT_24031 [Rozella allomycis CSF55]